MEYKYKIICEISYRKVSESSTKTYEHIFLNNEYYYSQLRITYARAVVQL